MDKNINYWRDFNKNRCVINQEAEYYFKSNSEIYIPENKDIFKEPIYVLFKGLYYETIKEVKITAFYLYKSVVFKQTFEDCLLVFFLDSKENKKMDVIKQVSLAKNLLSNKYNSRQFLIWLKGKDVYIKNNTLQHTYLMYDSNTGLTKIGKSKKPKIREKTLQSQKPAIDLFAICEDDIEKVLHNQYAFYRVRGEWFNLSQEQISDIINRYSFERVSH